MILRIPKALPSWNQHYAGVHWAKRAEQALLWHDLVAVAAGQATPFTEPVHIIVTRYGRRAIDCDNVCAKLAIDGLVKAGVIENDSPKYVESVTLRSKAGDPETVIEITSATGRGEGE